MKCIKKNSRISVIKMSELKVGDIFLFDANTISGPHMVIQATTGSHTVINLSTAFEYGTMDPELEVNPVKGEFIWTDQEVTGLFDK